MYFVVQSLEYLLALPLFLQELCQIVLEGSFVELALARIIKLELYPS